MNILGINILIMDIETAASIFCIEKCIAIQL